MNEPDLLSNQSQDSPSSGSLISWLRLMRVSNLPTAISNILVGYLIANGNWTPWLPLLLLVAASSMLYSAGMILNDVFDVEQDRKERPERPIPSGAIHHRLAAVVGFGLLAVAIAIAFYVSPRSGIVAVALASCIYLYDAALKKTLIAPFVMGACRTLNILLGASLATVSAETAILGFPALAIWVAISIGVAIAGITWIARNEAHVGDVQTSKVQSSLVFGTTLLLLGLAGLAFANLSPDVDPRNRFGQLFPFLILLVSITIIRRAFSAIWMSQPREIQSTVIAFLRSLIIFDAAICLIAVSNQIHFSLIVLCLLIPSLFLSRWIKQT